MWSLVVAVLHTEPSPSSQVPVYDDSCQYEEIPIDWVKGTKTQQAVTIVTTSVACQQTAAKEVSRLLRLLCFEVDSGSSRGENV